MVYNFLPKSVKKLLRPFDDLIIRKCAELTIVYLSTQDMLNTLPLIKPFFFIFRTDYPIDIAWIDYNGNLVRYRKELTGGGVCHQNTFVTHPWIAWHSRTLERVSLGGNNVFLPQPWQGEQHRTIVYIDRPGESLLCYSTICVLILYLLGFFCV